jgi:tRNA threonylcarbamoyladenosine biosynthesis protein TsaB
VVGVIVGIDTSSAMTSIAVIDDDDSIVVERSHRDPRRHAEVIGPMLAEVVSAIDPRQVDAVVCGVGPGPYTGLRVGIASAIGLAAAWDVPVYGVCSLDAVAAAALVAHPGEPVAVAVDARRSEVYWARYDATGRRVAGPRVQVADEAPTDAVTEPPMAAWVARCARPLLAAGAVPSDVDVPLDEHGTDTGRTARALEGSRLLPARPLYLRRPDAQVAS